MRKTFKFVASIMFSFLIAVSLVACGSKPEKGNSVPEKIELSKVVLSEVEFENANTVKLEQKDSTVTVSGTIDAMSASQKNAFGVQDVTHVVALKMTFDKEKTLKSFEIKGDKTKVFSENSSDDNYAGSLSELLDNEASEDAYTNLVLSANTKEYTLTAKYTDESTSAVKVVVKATLAVASAE